MALEGTYPIMIDGELAGKLTVTAQGVRTVFDAVCRPLAGIVRISVYGGGREGALGVLAPDGERFGLHKALSRTELKAFPAEIESVERSGLQRPAIPEAAAEPDAELVPEESPELPAPVPEEPTPEEQPQEDEETPKAEEDDDLFWYSSPDGALVCFDGTRSLIALPVGDARIPEGFGGERRIVEGREYLVYKTKNGKIVH